MCSTPLLVSGLNECIANRTTLLCSLQYPWQHFLHVCMQVSRAEFILLWMTFVAIIYTDLETGIFAGVVFSVFYFAYSYAKVHPGITVSVLRVRSMCTDQDTSATQRGASLRPFRYFCGQVHLTTILLFIVSNELLYFGYSAIGTSTCKPETLME